MTVGIFQDLDIRKTVFTFPMSPAMNDTLRAYHPTLGTCGLNLVQIRLTITEIFTSERSGSVVGEVWKTTTAHFRPL